MQCRQRRFIDTKIKRSAESCFAIAGAIPKALAMFHFILQCFKPPFRLGACGQCSLVVASSIPCFGSLFSGGKEFHAYPCTLCFLGAKQIPLPNCIAAGAPDRAVARIACAKLHNAAFDIKNAPAAHRDASGNPANFLLLGANPPSYASPHAA